MDAVVLRQDWMEAGASNRSHPAFYQFMSRLEKSGYIKAARTVTGVAGTKYRLLRKGEKAMESSHRFYCNEEDCD